MRVLRCFAVLFVLFAARASFAQENCSTVLVADGVDFSMLKGGAVGSDLEPLNLDEDGDGIPDRSNEPSPDENGAPTLGWTLEDFDASDWEIAPSGFGYGDRLDIIGTVLDDMEESYVSVYLRHTFEIENLAGINSMAFNMDYDDSFVAYINGVEVARASIGSGSGALAKDIESHEAKNWELFSLGDGAKLAALCGEGRVTLAIEGHNRNKSGGDFSLQPCLLGPLIETGSDLNRARVLDDFKLKPRRAR